MKTSCISVTVESSSTSKPPLPRADEVDVLLLLEGTFPFVAGGVSSWVNQIIRGFPDLRFGAIFIGSRVQDYGEMRYSLPDNLVHLETVYLYEDLEKSQVRPTKVRADKAMMADVQTMHDLLHTNIQNPDAGRLFAGLMNQACPHGKLSLETFLHSEASWKLVKDGYRNYSTDPSFVDYFWTVRTMHAPFWRLRDVAGRCPKARIYHAVSTGYAGILGVLLKHRNPRPFILSEHGIYVKERKIDLYQAQWIKDNRGVFERDPSQVSYYRQLWIRFFEHLGYLTYQACDQIVALYEANRQRQLTDGAPPDRTINIPNGVDIKRFGALRPLREPGVPAIMCLIGRVVPIKDIKTFVRAMRTVVDRMPHAQGWIAGPEEEDPDYAAECHELVERLNLQDHVKFLGFQQLTDILPKVGLVVLSSISEALPLVILEGYAAGVPTVSTDVGSCRQLVYGLAGEDEAIGPSGRIVRIADPDALAGASIELLSNPVAWEQASQAGVARVEKYYAQHMLFERYRALYEQGFAWQA